MVPIECRRRRGSGFRLGGRAGGLLLGLLAGDAFGLGHERLVLLRRLAGSLPRALRFRLQGGLLLGLPFLLQLRRDTRSFLLLRRDASRLGLFGRHATGLLFLLGGHAGGLGLFRGHASPFVLRCLVDDLESGHGFGAPRQRNRRRKDVVLRRREPLAQALLLRDGEVPADLLLVAGLELREVAADGLRLLDGRRCRSSARAASPPRRCRLRAGRGAAAQRHGFGWWRKSQSRSRSRSRSWGWSWSESWSWW